MPEQSSEDTSNERQKLLDNLTRNKKNRSTKEVEKLLEAFDFVRRDASKEASVWSRGRSTLTLPNSHGKSLKTKYVGIVIRIIREAEAADSREGDDDGT